MANPYHDEAGKFCSRDGMKTALARLEKTGDVAGYLKLRQEFDEIEASNTKTSKGNEKLQALTQDTVNEKLRELGNKFLKEPYKSQWSEDNPTLGYCYIVSEAIFHYGGLENPTPYVISFPEGGTHWFIKDGDKIYDFTSEQFDFPVDYSKANRCPFFKGGVETPNGKFISKRGHVIAQMLNFAE